jgi:Holliday junction DNA helicase RuvA
MIHRIHGRLLTAGEMAAVVELGGLCLELSTPRSADADLAQLVGGDVVFHTVFYLEGNAVAANFTPRLLGFLTEVERDFFTEFTRVKGVGMRKALRAMSVPAHQIAAAIEAGDERALTALPEIGKKMAAQIVTDLRGQLARFVTAPIVAAGPIRALSSAQRVAVDILVQWGDRRLDAEQLIAAAVEADSALQEPDQIVKAAYRLKSLSSR